tara:strand:+ start:127 stop:408 length:282 start_codon:yes stop_codon:yes gene_type:complete
MISEQLSETLRASIGFVISKLTQRIAATADEKLSVLNLQTKHVSVMTLVAEYVPKTQKEIGDSLKSEGWVSREQHSPDRRAFHISYFWKRASR